MILLLSFGDDEDEMINSVLSALEVEGELIK